MTKGNIIAIMIKISKSAFSEVIGDAIENGVIEDADYRNLIRNFTETLYYRTNHDRVLRDMTKGGDKE